MKNLEKIGFGGGCHWCTEAVFQSLKGVDTVEQGWIASLGEASSLSEAVVVTFDPVKIALASLLEIHLLTHKSASNHSMRKKYRSAVYTYSQSQEQNAKMILESLRKDFDHELITRILRFAEFRSSEERYKNYYFKNPEKPFCENVINPKLKLLLERFSSYTDNSKLQHLKKHEPF